jgi:hypothetical protein
VLPDGVSPQRGVALIVRDDAGVVWRGTAWSRERVPASSLTLAPGSYTVDATAGELRATGPLVVGTAGPAKVTLRLERP